MNNQCKLYEIHDERWNLNYFQCLQHFILQHWPFGVSFHGSDLATRVMPIDWYVKCTWESSVKNKSKVIYIKWDGSVDTAREDHPILIYGNYYCYYYCCYGFCCSMGKVWGVEICHLFDELNAKPVKMYFIWYDTLTFKLIIVDHWKRLSHRLSLRDKSISLRISTYYYHYLKTPILIFT